LSKFLLSKKGKGISIEASYSPLIERWKALSFVKNGIKLNPGSSKSCNESCTVRRMLRTLSAKLNPFKAGWGNCGLQTRKPHCWVGVLSFRVVS